MSSIYAKDGRLYCRLKVGGKWTSKGTKYRPGDEELARRYAQRRQQRIDEQESGAAPVVDSALTVKSYALDTWIKEREVADLDWKVDLGRLKHHILPAIGHLPIASVGTPKLVEMMRALRFPKDPADKLAQRTIYNIYSVVSALFRDAQLTARIDHSPCTLGDETLGPLVDSDPRWRAQAVFTRAEAEQLISDGRIAFDRRLYYAFGLLAGLRPGEIAALRVQSYDASYEVLGQLVVDEALNTRKNRIKSTKTDTVRYVPVHPVLAAMLGEWLLSGYEAMTGKKPEPGDLLLPLPPKATDRRRSRKGEPIRSGDYAGKRWREEDMALLQAEGWRYREMYSTKSTFITLVLDDGADKATIKERVTHAKPQEDAFDGYNRGLQWARTCAEVAKLKISRRDPACYALATRGQVIEMTKENSGGGGSRTRVRKCFRPNFYACRHAI